MFEVNGSFYTDYRIPSMVISPAGEIYVAYECRANSSDWAEIVWPRFLQTRRQR